MKIKKMLTYIIIIFLIIQLFEIFFINKKSYATYFGVDLVDHSSIDSKSFDEAGKTSTLPTWTPPKTQFGATIVKGVLVFLQILTVGFFTIKLTIQGIRYFTVVSIQEKANLKGSIEWTIFFGVLAFLILFFFSYYFGVM